MEAEKQEDAFSRLYVAAGCRTQVELAKFLEIRQSSISDAKRRNSVPSDWLLKLLRLKWVNPDWILTGLGPKKLGPASEGNSAKVLYVVKVSPPKDCSSQELVNELVRRAFAEMDVVER